MKKCCLTCQHFTWWDGDYCCTHHFNILSGADNKNKATHPEKVLNNSCDDYSQEYLNQAHLKIVITCWNKCNPENQYID